MRQDKREEAIKLRGKGFSYSEIKEIISVSKCSLSLWLRDIALTDDQKERLIHKGDKARLLGSKALKEARIRKTKQIFKEAKSEVGNINILVKKNKFSPK